MTPVENLVYQLCKGFSSTPTALKSEIKERLFDVVKPPFKMVHYLKGDAEDINEECGRYSKLLQEDAIDLACIGIGENGHLAFNDPPANFQTPHLVHQVLLDEACRKQQLGEGWFSTLDEVPRVALTLSIPAIVNAHQISVVCPDKRKAEAIRKTLEMEVSPQVPSSVLRNHKSVVMWLDRDSASLLSDDTLKTCFMEMNIPGAVDLQINGYKGTDFSSPLLTETQLIHAFHSIIQSGTVAFLPTVITSSEETYQHVLPLISKVSEREEFKMHVLGIHCEGPFISKKPGYVGCHNPDYVRLPDISFFENMYQWANRKIKLLTIAAELPGANTLATYAIQNGVTIALGHQEATESDLENLVNSGATLLTHLGNGVPTQLHRHLNPIWEGCANEHLSATIIVDGFHLPKSVIKTIIHAKGNGKVCVVSDAISVAGLPSGEYECFGIKVVIDENGKCCQKGKDNFAGSVCCVLDGLNYLLSIGFSVLEVEKMGFFNPLGVLGINTNIIQKKKLIKYTKGKLLSMSSQ